MGGGRAIVFPPPSVEYDPLLEKMLLDVVIWPEYEW